MSDSVNKLLILNSPNNPSGTTHTNLKELAEIVKKYNVIVLSDEIYAELDFSGIYKSITHFYPEGTIISSSMSKWCGAGGWRLGFIAVPRKLKVITALEMPVLGPQCPKMPLNPSLLSPNGCVCVLCIYLAFYMDLIFVKKVI